MIEYIFPISYVVIGLTIIGLLIAVLMQFAKVSAEVRQRIREDRRRLDLPKPHQSNGEKKEKLDLATVGDRREALLAQAREDRVRAEKEKEEAKKRRAEAKKIEEAIAALEKKKWRLTVR